VVYGREGAGETLDLSYADLRSVSPVHIQYLGNMQVQGSFSLSIMLDGKLWGLVACHNEQAGPIPLGVRLACAEQVAQLVAVLSARRLAQHKHIADSLAASVVGGLGAASSAAALGNALCTSLAALQGLLDFGGAVVDVGGETFCSGTALRPDLARALMAATMDAAFESVATCESLPQGFAARADCQAAGVFGFACIHLRAPHLGNALVSLALLRPEEAGEVAWAGNPEKPVELNAGGAIQLSPRTSFEKWMQVREGMCRVWTEDDRFTLGLLRRQLEAALS
jgi:light-regulated signal transduction histidine kinase (bacteriophytochrome)